MTIYLTGNREDGNYYNGIESKLKRQNHKVINALRAERNMPGVSAEIMRDILNMLIDECDAVMMLSDWQQFDGAKEDFYHAAATKKMILFQDFKDEDLCYG